MGSACKPDGMRQRRPDFGNHASGGSTRVEQTGSMHANRTGVGFGGFEVRIIQVVRLKNLNAI